MSKAAAHLREQGQTHALARRATQDDIDLALKAAAITDNGRGIPDRSRYGDPTKLPLDLVTLARQEHDARRAGLHEDVRLGTKDLGLFSWATKKGLPAPGGKMTQLFQTPIHDFSYRGFQGKLRGYGAGTVRRKELGEALVTATSPRKIEFTTASRKSPERFLFVRPNDSRTWLARNTTPTEPLEEHKIRHKAVAPAQLPAIIRNGPEGTVAQPKIDGASALIQLAKRGPELFSYRADENGRPITYTEKFFGNRPKAQYGSGLVGSVLRGEVYGVNRGNVAGGRLDHPGPGRLAGDEAGAVRHGQQEVSPGVLRLRDDSNRNDYGQLAASPSDERDRVRAGTVLHPQQLGGILNATIANSIRAQRERGVDLRTMLFDAQRIGRRELDPHVVPYAERRQLLEQVLPYLPQGKFHIAPQVEGREAIQGLWDQIAGGRHELTGEGLVLHPPTGRPMKAKLGGEHDVVATGVFPGKGRRAQSVGGLTYAHPDRPGHTVGRVGSGFSDESLRQIAADPESYIGRTARLKAQEKYRTGALRAPVFLAWHEDLPLARPAH